VITVFGSLNVDLVARVAVLPRPGETVLAETYATHCGGKGANQAVAAARASGGTTPVRMAGAIGRDGFGALCRDNLAREYVDIDALRETDEATGCAFIQVDAAGENVITVASGANRLASAAFLADRPLSAGDWLVLQLEVPLEECIAAARTARLAGAQVIANLAPVPTGAGVDALAALLGHATILIVNEHEALQAATMLGLGETTPDAIAAGIAAAHGCAVVVTLGPVGALASDASGRAVRVAAPRITPVDTTGAGDTFVGVLAAFVAEGLSLEPAMGLACKGAALACLAVGAQSAMPRRAAILR
jgi:ribokinase